MNLRWSGSSTLVAVIAAGVLGSMFAVAGTAIAATHREARRTSRATLTATQTPVVSVVQAQCDGYNVTAWLSTGELIRIYPVSECPATVALWIGDDMTLTPVIDVSQLG